MVGDLDDVYRRFDALWMPGWIWRGKEAWFDAVGAIAMTKVSRTRQVAYSYYHRRAV